MGRTNTYSGQNAKLILTGDKCRSVFWKLSVLLLWHLNVKRSILQPTGVTSTWTVAIHVPKPICPKINSCSVWSTGLHSVVWSTEWGIFRAAKPQIHSLSSNLSAPLSHTHAARQSSPPVNIGRLRLKCEGTHADIRSRLSAKRTSPFKSAGGRQFSRLLAAEVCAISGSNAGYTMFRRSVKFTGYPLHSPVSPSPPLPCVAVCHHISTELYSPY